MAKAAVSFTDPQECIVLTHHSVLFTNIGHILQSTKHKHQSIIYTLYSISAHSRTPVWSYSRGSLTNRTCFYRDCEHRKCESVNLVSTRKVSLRIATHKNFVIQLLCKLEYCSISLRVILVKKTKQEQIQTVTQNNYHTPMQTFYT